MTFSSSVVQDAGVITAINQMLKTSPMYSNIIQRLQVNFLERTKPWTAMSTKYDFTTLLDSYRLGLILGKSTLARIPVLTFTCLNIETF